MVAPRGFGEPHAAHFQVFWLRSGSTPNGAEGREPGNLMAKIRVKSQNKPAKAKPGLFRENLRALPCMVLVILGMVLVFYVFYLGLRGS